jgi:hypothetical protein
MRSQLSRKVEDGNKVPVLAMPAFAGQRKHGRRRREVNRPGTGVTSALNCRGATDSIHIEPMDEFRKQRETLPWCDFRAHVDVRYVHANRDFEQSRQTAIARRGVLLAELAPTMFARHTMDRTDKSVTAMCVGVRLSLPTNRRWYVSIQ